MSKKTKAENPKNTVKSTGKKPVAKSVRVKAVRKPKTAVPTFDFVGRVESIRARATSSGPEFVFMLRGRKSSHQSFRLTGDHAAAMMAMAHIVIAAHDKDAKIGVRSEKSGEGGPVAVEIAWRPKLGKGD